MYVLTQVRAFESDGISGKLGIQPFKLSVTLFCSALAARAQSERVRRIDLLVLGDENDPVAKTFVSVFTQGLADLGWIDGRNVRIDLRWHADDIHQIPAIAQCPS